MGRNCVLLLNVPPDTTGQFAEEDVQRLRAFREDIDEIFDTDLTNGAKAEANAVRGEDRMYGAPRVLDGNRSTYWAPREDDQSGKVVVDFEEEETFNVVRLQEPITMGQRVSRYRVEAWQSEEGEEATGWETISEGTTIGYKKLDRLPKPVTSQRIRIVVEKALATPILSEMGVHFDPHPAPWVQEEE